MAKISPKQQAVIDEAERLKKATADMMKRMESSGQQIQALIEYFDQEHKKLESEAPSPTKQRKLYLSEIRRQGALCNHELLQTIMRINPSAPISEELLHHIDCLSAKTHLIVIDSQAVNYRATLDVVNAALRGDEAPAKAPTGPIRPGTGPMAGRAAGPGAANKPAGTGRLGQGLPARQAGTGPIGAPNVPGRTGTGKLNPAPAQAPAQRTASGPLGPRGTGSLRGSTGRLPTQDPAYETLKRAAADPAQRQLLNDLVARASDLDSFFDGIRGETPGTYNVSLPEIQQLVKQAASKVYYVERVLQQLGPTAAQIQFQNANTDPNIAKVLQSLSEAPAAAAASGAKAQPGAGDAGLLTGILKSFFK